MKIEIPTYEGILHTGGTVQRLDGGGQLIEVGDVMEVAEDFIATIVRGRLLYSPVAKPACTHFTTATPKLRFYYTGCKASYLTLFRDQLRSLNLFNRAYKSLI